jgi:signal transduction histidine kinase
MPAPERADQRPTEEAKQPAEVTRLAAELRSVTRQLETRQRQLDRSEARFRDIIERNADAIVVVDSSGMIRFANRAATELFNAPLEELIGSDFGFPLVAGDTTEVDVLSAGVPHVAEMRVVRSEWDGADAHIASLRDVTLRKRAERDARRVIQAEAARVVADESARRFRLLAEASELLSSTLNTTASLDLLARLCVRGGEIADWAVVYCLNGDDQPRRVHVIHRDPAKEAAAKELCAIPIDPRSVHPVLDVLKSRRSRVERDLSEIDLGNLTASSRELELTRILGIKSFMLLPMVARGRALGAITFVRDRHSTPFDANDLALAEQLTARAAIAVDNARLYDEANQANKTKADFLAVVSHDLRTPLTAIMGYSDLLLMGMPDPLSDGSRDRIERIRASAKHLVYLINELLSFARLDAGREEIHPQDVDLCEVVREVRSVVEPLAAEKSLELVIEVPEAPAQLTTDPDKVRQILLNLVGNAIKYTKTGGVTVKLLREKNHFRIHVRDTGPGIAPQHLGRIFEAFWQVESTQRSQGGGTGLGLSVVKRLTTMLGGRVEVQSVVGEGSLFTLSLPS